MRKARSSPAAWRSAPLLLSLLLAACADARVPPLEVATTIWLGYEPLYLARELGLLDEQQVRLVECTSASDVMRALRNGAVDAAALTLDEALFVRQWAPDLAALGGLRFPSLAENKSLLVAPEAQLRFTAARLGQVMLEQRLLASPIDARGLIDGHVLSELAP